MEKKIFRLDSDSVSETQPMVRDFEVTNLTPGSAGVFRTPTLDARRTPRLGRKPDAEVRDRRFHVDPVLRDLLSVDDQTDAEIDARVARKLAEVSEQAQRDGREKGYDEGYERGQAEAKQTFELAAQEKLASLDALISAFEAAKPQVYAANERFLVELVYKISASVLQKEIILDSEYLARVVRSVVEKVGVKEQLKLIASTTQIETLYAMLPELEKKYSELKNITIESSSMLGEADVVIETDWNRIDATLDSQLGSLHEIVLAALDDSQQSSGGQSETA